MKTHIIIQPGNVKIPAVVYGPLAIHREVATTVEGEAYAFTDSWVVTHVATGLRLSNCPLLCSEARKMARMLVREFPADGTVWRVDKASFNSHPDRKALFKATKRLLHEFGYDYWGT